MFRMFWLIDLWGLYILEVIEDTKNYVIEIYQDEIREWHRRGQKESERDRE